MKTSYSFSLYAGALCAVLGLLPSTAQAVPSYARQTGLACNGCHTTPPELNAAGRRFKLTGYTDREKETPTISNDAGTRHAGLDLLKILPLSAWFETSITQTKSPQPETQNGTYQFPQDVSLFLAGAWSQHIGSFIQITYDPTANRFTSDNTDIRITNKGTWAGKELVYGLTLNNNPTVEDLWHSTPAWGFPFVASPTAPTPSATPFVQGSLAQDVAGLGGYAMWNEHLYLAAAGYRSNHIGASQPNSGKDFGTNIQGVAPYWRLAWQQSIGTDNYLEVGTYGMQIKSTPGGVIGLQDRLTDRAVDFQYDRTVFVRDVISLRGAYVRENSSLVGIFGQDGASQSAHNLRLLTANAEYHFGNIFSSALGWNKVTGTTDELLYAPASVTGSANGSPNSTSYTANLSWWPIQNFQVAAQYTGYPRFNGGAMDYDGSGRNARQNNTVYLLGRFLF